MNSLQFLIVTMIIFSTYIGFRIFNKILNEKKYSNKKNSIVEKIFLILFITIIILILNAMTFIMSYNFFWQKAYRSKTENHYVGIVVGYKKEISKTQNFQKSTYYDTYIFFPKVSYINDDGKTIIKTLDITSRKPFKIGEKVKLSDNLKKNRANTESLNWGIFILGGFFTGIAAFFLTLLSSYISIYSLKKRINLSIIVGISIIFVNLFCVIILYF